METGTRTVRAGSPRRTAWAIGTALAVASVVAAAWIASGRDGSPPNHTLPAPTRVALVYAKPLGHGPTARREAVYAASSPNGRPRRLDVGTSPLLSPDGNWVAYVGGRVDHPAGVRLISTLGGAPRIAGVSGEPVAWSGNSRFLAVQGAGGLGIVDVRSLRVASIPLPEASGNFSFSPDGSMLAFQHSTGAGSDIYTVARIGGRIHRLTGGHRTGYPLWGPTGIAFERFGTDRCAKYCHGDVWVMNADGSDQRRLTHTDAGIYPAAWSADGRRILAAYPATHNGKLYAVDGDTGAARPLTAFVGDLYPQGLSRDGRTVLAAIGCGGTTSPYGLVETIPFAGGAPTVIVRGPCRASSNF